jgi:hypothetical protein
MAKVTLVFAALLIALGLAGFLGTGHVHYTALIPAWFGLALGVFGGLALSPIESRRKLFMHINVTIGLLGFLGALFAYLVNYVSREPVDLAAMGAKLAMVWLLFIYVALCVRSFLLARRSGKD